MSARAANRISIPFPSRLVAPRLQLDLGLLLLFLLIMSLGLVMMTSASMPLADQEFGNPFHYLYRQLFAIAIGLGAACTLLLIPTAVWRNTSFLLLLFALALLALVIVPGVGVERNYSTRWLALGGMLIQVSEPARLALILYVAGYIMRHQQELRTSFTGFLRPMAMLSLAAALLLAEPDFGAAAVLLATTLAMLFVGGARWRDFVIVALTALAGLAAIAVSKSYRLERLVAFLDPWQDPNDKGYQLVQSLIAVGRGEWAGVGLGGSVQKLSYLPEAHTDFVFAIFAEECGLLGALTLIGLFFLLILRIFRLARLCAARQLWFQAYTAFGIGTWLGLQSFINIGVNVGALPTKGLTLPLISYGRSSVIVVLAAMGLLLRIHHELQQPVAVGRKRAKRAGGRS